jgi:hypothetical protein
MGDRRWRELPRCTTAQSRQIERHRGRLIKSTGDGVLAVSMPQRSCSLRAGHSRRLAPIGLRGLRRLARRVELVGDDIAGIAVHIAAC